MSNIVNQDLDKVYDKMEFQLGQEVEIADRLFQFVKYNSGAGDVDAIAGKVGYLVSPDTTASVKYEVTMDYSSNAAATAITIPNAATGFFQAALTDEKYGWMQKSGDNRKEMYTDGNVSRNDQLSVDTTDGRVITLVSGNPDLPTVAIALQANVDTEIPIGGALITIPD